MPTSEDSLFGISSPFGKRVQRVNSSRYSWDNHLRGEEPFVIIQRTLSGNGIFRWGNRDWQVPADHAFIAVVPESSAYFYPYEAASPWVFTWLNFYGRLGILLCRELRLLYGPVLPLPGRSAAGLAFNTLAAGGEKRVVLDPYDSSIACYSFLTEWMRQLSSPQGTDTDPVETVRRICAARFREPLGIKELAAETGLSREHLTRLFGQRTGVSRARHLSALRLEAARRMLADKSISIKEAALRCGFPSPRALGRMLAENAGANGPGTGGPRRVGRK